MSRTVQLIAVSWVGHKIGTPFLILGRISIEAQQGNNFGSVGIRHQQDQPSYFCSPRLRQRNDAALRCCALQLASGSSPECQWGQSRVRMYTKALGGRNEQPHLRRFLNAFMRLLLTALRLP